VSIQGTTVCKLTCDSTAVLDQINDALAGRGSVTFPAPKIVQGAHGGVAEVSVDDYQHIEDVLFNDELPDSVVSPGMLVNVFADGTAPSRQMTRLASVGISQAYERFRVGQTTDGSTGTGGTSGGSGGTVGTVGTAGTPGTTNVIPGKGTNGQPPATAGTPTGALDSLINGLRVVLRHPSQVLGIACVWMLLALPAYLAARRRLLLELPRLRRVQEDV
jgi:hypothetical protein